MSTESLTVEWDVFAVVVIAAAVTSRCSGGGGLPVLQSSEQPPPVCWVSSSSVTATAQIGEAAARQRRTDVGENSDGCCGEDTICIRRAADCVIDEGGENIRTEDVPIPPAMVAILGDAGNA